MPRPKNPRYPVVSYLRAEKRHLDELNRTLTAAAKELEAQILAQAGKSGPGAVLTTIQARAQLAAIQRYIGRLWGRIEDITREAQQAAARSASDVVHRYEQDLLSLVMDKRQLADLAASEAQRAAAGVQNTMARILSSNVPLSERVYKANALSSGAVSDVVNRALAQGLSARELAKQVRDLIDPSVPGGVSYSAFRLARTETNNAFHATSIQRYKESGLVDEVDWVLSSSHPEGDVCDDLAADGPYPVDQVPKKPHPQCFCGITPHLPEPNEFLKKMLNGDYGDTRWERNADLPKFHASLEKWDIKPKVGDGPAKLKSMDKINALPKIATKPTTMYEKRVHSQEIVNPKRYDKVANKGQAYSTNCTRTTAVTELRMRGYDVTAGPRLRTVADNYNHNIQSMWQTAEGGVRGMTEFKSFSEALTTMEAHGAGARFFISAQFRGGYGHIWNAENNLSGRLIQFESQSAGQIADDYYKDFMRNTSIFILRVDDLLPTDKLVESVIYETARGNLRKASPWALPRISE